ncbi:MAG: hypothetical protein JXE07_09870 [Candidatus Aminicenantes bacterium]|nr:hypothetical protein [Candidatus Aminicenantes bacterium]
MSPEFSRRFMPPEELKAPLQKIRSYIETSMKAWGTPGLAVGIVMDGRG